MAGSRVESVSGTKTWGQTPRFPTPTKTWGQTPRFRLPVSQPARPGNSTCWLGNPLDSLNLPLCSVGGFWYSLNTKVHLNEEIPRVTQSQQMQSQENTRLPGSDAETEYFAEILKDQERIRMARVPKVAKVLVVLSSHGMVYDVEALRQKVVLTYPDAAVFFKTTSGKAIGRDCPQQVDLLIDLTGPRQRQGWFYARKLRSMATFAVGRNAGLFRKGIYDRIFDEKDPEQQKKLPVDMLGRERFAQRRVLELAGVALAQQGDALQDLGGSIALELPAMSRT